MKTIQKSPEQLQAQLAEFSRRQGAPETTYLFKHIAEIAAGPTDDIHAEAGYTNRPGDRMLPVNINYSEYITHLRNRDETAREEVTERAALLSSYETFSDDIELLRTGLPDVHSEATNYLGRGIASEAFLFEKAGNKYVARLPLPNRRRPEAFSIEDHIAASIRAQSIPRMERIVAASFEKGATVSEFVSGTPLRSLSFEAASQIPARHVGELVETAIFAGLANISVDFNSSNFIYNPQKGFTIIDSSPSDGLVPPLGSIAKLKKSFDCSDIHAEVLQSIPEDARPKADDYRTSVVLLRKLLSTLESATHTTQEERGTAKYEVAVAIERNIEWLRHLNEEVPAEFKPKRQGWLMSLISRSGFGRVDKPDK